MMTRRATQGAVEESKRRLPCASIKTLYDAHDVWGPTSLRSPVRPPTWQETGSEDSTPPAVSNETRLKLARSMGLMDLRGGFEDMSVRQPRISQDR